MRNQVEEEVAYKFGLQGSCVKELQGERDKNWLFEAESTKRYVVKITSDATPKSFVLFETDLMLFVEKRVGKLVPKLVASSTESRYVVPFFGGGEFVAMRVIEFLEGTLFGLFHPRDHLGLLQSLGNAVARLDCALQEYSGAPPERSSGEFQWSLFAARDVISRVVEPPDQEDPCGGFSLDKDQVALLKTTLTLLERAEETIEKLHSQIIHGDINDYNVFVQMKGSEPFVSGIIDFGDVHEAPRVFDLAVAVAYGILSARDALMAASRIVQGYHEYASLSQQELDVIYTLVCARLAQSVSMSAWRRWQQRKPLTPEEEEYLYISEKPAWSMLHTLQSTVDPAFGTAVLRQACGYPAVEGGAALNHWLSMQDAHPVLEPLKRSTCQLRVLDLSMSSTLSFLQNEQMPTGALSKALFSCLKTGEEENFVVGIGRYMEPRGLYTSHSFLGRIGDPRERRTIHLGVDLFVPAETKVFAPMQGTVHSICNNKSRLDYGPTLILAHTALLRPEQRSKSQPLPVSRRTFYTLYGHLMMKSMEHLRPGMSVAKGELVARVGSFPENGDWPPHLHFQVMHHLLGHTSSGNFPGVCLPRERHVWRSLCPNPNLLLRLPVPTVEYEGLDIDNMLERRKAVLGHNLSISYMRPRDGIKPIHIVKGRGSKLYDALGREYLDCVNNVAHVGHEHPHVVQQATLQMAVLNTNTRYLHEAVLQYAERLCALLPDPLTVCYFVNSGSEANELALRMARAHSKGTGVVALEGGYHGHTQGLIDISHYKFSGPGGRAPPPWVRVVPMPNLYRSSEEVCGTGVSSDADPDHTIGRRSAQHIAAAFLQLKEEDVVPAAFVSESILSCGGQIVLPKGYLRWAYKHARQVGAVCIADEVQTGFGRVGTHNWGFETQGVVPDIVTMGKPIGNGHPMAAVVTTREIADSFNNGMEFFSTFGGNPVSSAIGLAVLDVIERESLKENALRVGSFLLDQLKQLGKEHLTIGDVRGCGLFLGIELVTNRETKEPAALAADYIVGAMKERGVLLSTDGPLHNVIKIKPPMVFSMEDAEKLLSELQAVLEHHYVKSTYNGREE